MKRRWTSLVLAAALTMTATAHSYSEGVLNIDIGSGWRQDKVDYTSTYPTYSTIRGIAAVPLAVAEAENYVESVDYEGLRSWTFAGKAEYKQMGILARVYGQYGLLYSGHSSVISTNDTSPLLNSTYNAESDRGEVFDFGVAAGVPFCLHPCGFNVTFTPIVGWSQHEQHLRQQIAQIIADPSLSLLGLNPMTAPLLLVGANRPHMYNSYQTRWNGVFAGYDLAVDLPCSDIVLYNSFEWHFPHLLTRGQYNTDTLALVTPALAPTGITYTGRQYNYTQKGWGNGFVVRGGAEWFLNRCWSVGILGSYTRFWVDDAYQDATISSPATLAGPKSIGTTNIHWSSWYVVGTLGFQY
jgi:hypothetical protein